MVCRERSGEMGKKKNGCGRIITTSIDSGSEVKEISDLVSVVISIPCR